MAVLPSSADTVREPSASRGGGWQFPLRGASVAGLAVLAVIGAIFSIRYGPVPLSSDEVIAAVFGGGNDTATTIVRELRVPRVLTALLVGLNLGIAGVLMQAVARNPLADPGLTGVSPGAALAVTATLILSEGMPLSLPFAAFAGGMSAALVVNALAWQPGVGTSPLRMILAGVAIGSMLGAMTSFLMVYFSDRVQPVLLWLSGNLIGVSWKQVPLILPYSFLCLTIGVVLCRHLDILQLGDDAAAGLGLNVSRIRLLVLALGALAAASAVCVAGMVGFVGLVVPHIARMLVGPRHSRLLPAAAVTGACLLIWADLLARNLNELPVGILTSALGGPYFVFLIYRKRLV